MDEENLNLNEGQEDVVDSQLEQDNSTDEAVNADDVKATNDSQEETKPVQSAEENARFAEVRRKAAEEARAKAKDELISEMYGDQGIHTYSEYQAALEKQQQEQKLAEMVEKNIPEEYAKEILENRKFREQFETEQKAIQQQKQQQVEYQDFINAFPDAKPDEIPTEVWQINAAGVPLRYAYAEYALKLTREAEAKAKANADNAKGSMGNVSGDGVANDSDFISYDTYDKNRSNQSWVNKNFDRIMKSRAKW